MLLCVRGQACWIGVCSVPLRRFDQSETGARLCQPIGAYWSRVERVVVCMMFTCKPADRRGHGPWFWRHRSVPALWRHDGPTGVRRLKSNCFFTFSYFVKLLLLLSFHTMHNNDLNNLYYYLKKKIFYTKSDLNSLFLDIRAFFQIGCYRRLKTVFIKMLFTPNK